MYIQIRQGGGQGATLHGWYLVETVGKSGDIGAAEEEALSFKLVDIDEMQEGVKILNVVYSAFS